MLQLMWLVFSVPPVVIAHLPVPPLKPEVVQRLLHPPRCLQARCLRGEWRTATMPTIPAGQLLIDGNDLPGAGSQLYLPIERRDWVKAQGSNARVGMQYGLQALQTADTSVRFAIDTGYRLQGYADDGIAGTGPILRGQLEWNQTLGEHTRLSQTTRVETGQTGGAFLRNSLLLKMQLKPRLLLSSGLETRHDSELNGRNQTDATLKLHYAF